MATIVTIRGSLTPSVVLKRDQFKTVQLTERVQRLIDRGFVEVVETHEVDDVPEQTSDEGKGEPADDDKGSDGVPAAGATRKVWLEFVESLDPPIEVPENATRDAIVKAYEAYTQQREGGS